MGKHQLVEVAPLFFSLPFQYVSALLANTDIDGPGFVVASVVVVVFGCVIRDGLVVVVVVSAYV